jgi:hypothetical protein
MIGARACGDRVCIWMVVTIGCLLAHGCVMVPLRAGVALRAPLAVVRKTDTTEFFNS